MGYLIIMLMLGSFILMMIFIPRWIQNHAGKYWCGEMESTKDKMDNDFWGTMVSTGIMIVAALLLLNY